MKKNILRSLTLVVLMAILLGCFIACGNSSAANDAGGQWENITWTYTKNNTTLIVSGTGAMPDAKPTLDENGDESVPAGQNVSWAAVRSSVTKIIITDGITSIGDYAFYGMTSLTSVTIPSSVETIGKCSFAFCSSLKTVSLPEPKAADENGNGAVKGITSIGDSAFEGCASLTNITIPASVTSLGERSFAFCRDLQVVFIKGTPAKIGYWTFKECESLNKLMIDNKDSIVYDDAKGSPFSGIPNFTRFNVEEYNGNVIFTVKAVLLSDTNTVLASKDKVYSSGDPYSIVASEMFPDLKDYEISGTKNYSGTVESENKEFVFTYIPATKQTDTAAVESEAATEPVTEQPKNDAKTIIAIVVLVLVIIGIVVGIIFFVRSNKKADGKGGTVRKNDSKKNNSKKK